MVDRATLLKRAREMRLNPTEPEKRIWRHLSASQLDGCKFRRQAVIDHYIADFFCPQKKLIVEIDGDTHDIKADYKRDNRLKQLGYRTIRYTNSEVMENMDGVLTALRTILQETPDRWTARQREKLASPNPISGPCLEREGRKRGCDFTFRHAPSPERGKLS